MKNNTLYLLSGIQGSGKSTFIDKNDLKPLTISYDTIRELYVGTKINDRGIAEISNEQNDRVYAMGNQILRDRMRTNGGNIVIDNMNVDNDSILGFKSIADEHYYNTVVVKFPLMMIEHYYQINEKRPDFKKIDNRVLQKWHKIASDFNPSNIEGITVITPSEFENIINRKPDNFLRDLSQYKNVHIFGDLQGCFSVLNKYFKENNKLTNEDFYIFLGDYLDRGIENGLALKFVEKFIDKDNFFFIYGNHERHMMNHANDWHTTSLEFSKNTLPQLYRSGFTKENMASLFNKLEGTSYFKYGDKKILVSHAGFTTVPLKPFFVNKADDMFGYGGYGLNIDKIFSENPNNKDWIQAHGHRNQHELTFTSYPNSFALERSVEFGGYLPILKLENNNGKVILSGINVGNDIFDPKLKGHNSMEFTTRITDEKIAGYDKTIEENLTNLDIVKLLRDNELIKEKTFETNPHISSFNFTRDAFYDSKNSFRDELVSQARGIFLNNETGEIVARGFEKFFNINERGIEQAKMEHLKEHFNVPIQLFLKENGYLGLMGYDSKKDSLVYTSKSDIELEFAKNLENIAKVQFSESELDKLKTFARVNRVNYIFEVNDPVNDPHIVQYDKAHVVLLAIVKREFIYQELKYDDLKKFGEQFENLPVKQKGPRFPTVEAFEKFYNSVTGVDAIKSKLLIEGYVVEDANLNRMKIKLPFYNFWKVGRSFKDYISRQIEKIDEKVEKSPKTMKDSFIQELKNQTFQKIDSHGLLTDGDKTTMKDFITWFLTIPKEEQQKDIINLRNEFVKSDFVLKPVDKTPDEDLKNKITNKLNKIKPA